MSGTPLAAACEFSFKEIVLLLLENRADINRSALLCGTPLMAACGRGREDIVQLLLKRRAYYNRQFLETDLEFRFALFLNKKNTVSATRKRF